MQLRLRYRIDIYIKKEWNMKLIETTEALEKFCKSLEKQEFVTIDLEFLREKTYYAQLCLIQVASLEDNAIIDPLVKGLDMSSFFEILSNEKIMKVFHSGRQDIEILYKMTGFIPNPVFDTQIAAMVCGFGEAVSYETLVTNITEGVLDKSCRFSNWSMRPLNKKQLEYAICDVTHLVHIYLYLKKAMEDNHRAKCLEEEIEILKNPETYIVRPEEAWQRIKHRSHNTFFLTVLKELAEWREKRAQRKDIPRQNVIKDESLLNIAALCPTNEEDLSQIRNIRRDIVTGKLANEIIDVIKFAKQIPESKYVKIPREKKISACSSSLLELLKLLLKIKSQETGIVAKLIASEDNLKQLTTFNDEGNPVLKGWRYNIFGSDAVQLREGNINISFNKETKLVNINRTAPK